MMNINSPDLKKIKRRRRKMVFQGTRVYTGQSVCQGTVALAQNHVFLILLVFCIGLA